jgi:acyl dehydratase
MSSEEPRITRNIRDAVAAIGSGDPERGLIAPLYENIDPPESFGPVQVVVDETKIARYAFTQGDLGSWHLGAGPQGGPRVGQAGLLANDLLQLFTLRYAPSQVVGLHTEEELWFDRPVHLGEVVTLRAAYTEKFERRSQGYVVMEASATGADGSSILRHRGLEIMRTAPADIAGRGSAETDPEDRVTDRVDESLPRISDARDGLVVDVGLEPLIKETTLEQTAVFSRYGDGVLNIHNSVADARANGLNLPIVQGQQAVGYLAELLTRVFGMAWFSGGWLKVKFVSVVEVFDTVVVEGAIRRVEEHEDGTRTVHLHVWIRSRATGNLTAVGWARTRMWAEVGDDAYPPENRRGERETGS